MKSDNVNTHLCEYCDCNQVATHYNEYIGAWLCDEHEGGSPTADTGYCSEHCMLGYGCDHTC